MDELQRICTELHAFTGTLLDQMMDNFQTEMQDLVFNIDSLITKQQKPGNSPIVTKTPYKKRKLLAINEEQGSRSKRSKPSLNSTESTDACSMHGSMSVDGRERESSVLNQTEADVTGTETRAKRSAFKLAMARTTSLLHESLNTKKRRPSKIDEISVSLPTARLTRQGRKLTNMAIDIKIEIDDENKENSENATKPIDAELMPPPPAPPAKRGRKKVLKTRSVRSKNRTPVEETESDVELAQESEKPADEPTENDADQTARKTRGRKKKNTDTSIAIDNITATKWNLRNKRTESIHEIKSKEETTKEPKTKSTATEQIVAEVSENGANESTYNTRGKRKANTTDNESMTKRNVRNKPTTQKVEESCPKLPIDDPIPSESTKSIEDETETEVANDKKPKTRRAKGANKNLENSVLSIKENEETELTEDKSSKTGKMKKTSKNFTPTITEDEKTVENKNSEENATTNAVENKTNEITSETNLSPKKSALLTPDFGNSTPIRYSMRSTFVVSKSTEPSPKKSITQKSNETVVISPKGKTANVNNETVVISTTKANAEQDNETFTAKAYLTEEECNSSILTDDLTEIEETPQKPLMNVTKVLAKSSTAEIFSPVKSKVQYFECLADGDSQKRMTRTKTRAIVAAKENKEIEENDVNKTPTESQPKPATPATLKKTTSSIPVSHAQIVKPVVAKKPLNLNLIKSPMNLNLIKSPMNLNLIKSPIAVQTSSQEQVKHPVDSSKNKQPVVKPKQEKKKNWDEKYKAAALAREAQEKQRLALLEKQLKEEDEKNKARQMEAEKKKQHLQNVQKRIAEERRLAEEERKRKKEEVQRIREKNKENTTSDNNAKPKHDETYSKKLKPDEIMRKLQEKIDPVNVAKYLGMQKTSSVSSMESMKPSYKKFEDLHTDDESEDEKNPKRQIPTWSQKSVRSKQLKIQHCMKDSTVDKLYSSKIFNPDVRDIFPSERPYNFKRTSSVCWRTPPRFSMIPANFPLSDD